MVHKIDIYCIYRHLTGCVHSAAVPLLTEWSRELAGGVWWSGHQPRQHQGGCEEIRALHRAVRVPSGTLGNTAEIHNTSN